MQAKALGTRGLAWLFGCQHKVTLATHKGDQVSTTYFWQFFAEGCRPPSWHLALGLNSILAAVFFWRMQPPNPAVFKGCSPQKTEFFNIGISNPESGSFGGDAAPDATALPSQILTISRKLQQGNL